MLIRISKKKIIYYFLVTNKFNLERGLHEE
nr:MAG TPA: hypothetical protein [Caudoviricetes sp.]